ncbi:hypothetical protein VQ643_08310 [Pseudomonas sp. F1_0610]|uniref:hypothetical protein n=1 Tax=Pseudomonas sp. F1_0610 TaxID=3114284 RepID=UPI0039C43012
MALPTSSATYDQTSPVELQPVAINVESKVSAKIGFFMFIPCIKVMLQSFVMKSKMHKSLTVSRALL